MKQRNPEDTLSLVGEIVELCEKDGGCTVKILLKAVCLNVDMRDDEELTLGDTLIVETRIAKPVWNRPISLGA